MLFYRFFILYGYAVFLNHAAPVSFRNILNSASPYVAEETDCAAVISTVPMVFPSNVYVRVPMTSPSFTGACDCFRESQLFFDAGGIDRF